MSKGKQRISRIALTVMQEYNARSIGYGDLDGLHEIWDRSGLHLKKEHPLNVCKAVLDAIDRESQQDNALFNKYYWQAMRGIARRFYPVESDPFIKVAP